VIPLNEKGAAYKPVWIDSLEKLTCVDV